MNTLVKDLLTKIRNDERVRSRFTADRNRLYEIAKNLLMIEYQDENVLAFVENTASFFALVKLIADVVVKRDFKLPEVLKEWFLSLGFSSASYLSEVNLKRMYERVPDVYKYKGSYGSLELLLRHLFGTEEIEIYERVLCEDKKLYCYRDGVVYPHIAVVDGSVLESDPYWQLPLNEIPKDTAFPLFTPYVTVVRKSKMRVLRRAIVELEYRVRGEIRRRFLESIPPERNRYVFGISTPFSLTELFLVVSKVIKWYHKYVRQWYPAFFSTPLQDLQFINITGSSVLSSYRVLAHGLGSWVVSKRVIESVVREKYDFNFKSLYDVVVDLISHFWDRWGEVDNYTIYDFIRTNWSSYSSYYDSIVWDVANLLYSDWNVLRESIVVEDSVALFSQVNSRSLTWRWYYNEYLPEFYQKLAPLLRDWMSLYQDNTLITFDSIEWFDKVSSLLRPQILSIENAFKSGIQELTYVDIEERSKRLDQLNVWLYDVLEKLGMDIDSSITNILPIPESSFDVVFDFLKPHYVRTLEESVVKVFEVDDDTVFVVDVDNATIKEKLNVYSSFVLGYCRWLVQPMTFRKIDRQELYNLDQLWTTLNAGITLDESSFVLFKRICGKSYLLKPPILGMMDNVAWDIRYSDYAPVFNLPKLREDENEVVIGPTYKLEPMCFRLQKVIVPDRIKVKLRDQVGYVRHNGTNYKITENPNLRGIPKDIKRDMRARMRSVDWWALETLDKLVNDKAEYYVRYGDDMVIMQSYKDGLPEYNMLIVQN